MKRSPQPRRTAELSKSLQQQLNMYALAASAAAFALTEAAEAKVIYTPTNVVLTLPTQQFETYGVDLNHDGVVDFRLTRLEDGGSFVFASGNSSQGNGIAVGERALALALRKGAPVSNERYFIEGTFLPIMASRTGSASKWSGFWANSSKGVKDRYLGVRFNITGKIHYGWARVSFDFNRYRQLAWVVLSGYAYETIPNKPIIAGKTKGPGVTTVSRAGLGHLAAGASTIPAWRSRE